MALSIQELNAPSNPIWDFFNSNNGREGQGPSNGEQPPWDSFFRGRPNWGHGPLPNRGMPPQAAGFDGRPPPYPRPFESEDHAHAGEEPEATPATEPTSEKEDYAMDEKDDERPGPGGEHERRERHGHRHGSRGRGCGRGGFGGRGRGWGHHGHGHGHGFGHHGRDFGGFGRGGWGNWQNFIADMAKSGMGPIAEHYKQNMPNHPFARWAKDNMDSQEFTPPVDVYDTPDSYEIHLSLPGAKKENVSVTYNAEESTVNISGIVERPGNAEFLEYMAMSERQIGAFERKVRLGTRTEPAPVDDTHIGAKLEDGVLRVHVPKILREEEFVEVRKVDIQ